MIPGFKKISSTKDITVLKHPSGHEIRVAHKALSADMKKKLAAMPEEGKIRHLADGGEAEETSSKGAPVDWNQQAQMSEREMPSFDFKSRAGQGLASLPKTMEEEQAREQPQATLNPSEAQPRVQVTAPTSMQAQPSVQQGYSPADQMGALREQMQGQMMQAEAMGQGAAEQSKFLQQSQKDAQAHAQIYQEKMKNYDSERAAANQEVKDFKFEPERVIKNMSTGDHILTAISLMFGGMGSALTGGPNVGYQILKNRIDQDLEAQKMDLGKKENFLSHLNQQYKNAQEAEGMYRIHTNDMIGHVLEQKALEAKSAAAKGQMLAIKGMFDQQSAQIQNQMAIRAAASGMQVSGTQVGQLKAEDPSGYVSSLVPKEHQAQVFKEIGAAQDTRRMANSIIGAFDEAAKENTVLRTGAGLVRTPASVMALHQAMQPTFKDLEGTVRQAAMDNTFKNITPAPGDSQDTVDTKRRALMDYLQSKAAAPTAKGYGIDLGRFQSTAPYQEAETKMVGGKKYVRQGNIGVRVQ